MTDRLSVNPTLFARPEELRRAADLMFFAHRDFSGLADDLLARAGLGRAHQRALHFIARDEGISVGALIATLKVTKQSLARVLKDLHSCEMVDTRASQNDRRKRELYLKPRGADLLREIETLQHQRIIDAYRSAGPEAIAAFWDILTQLVDPQDRERVRDQLGLEPSKSARPAPR